MQRSKKQIENRNFVWSDRHFDFVETQHHCALCGSELEIKVESYLEDHMIREEAFCKHCNLKTRQKDHKMQ